MLKNKRGGALWLSLVLVFFVGGALFAVSPASAGMCHQYNVHKRYKTKENKKIYFKIGWVKKNEHATYTRYRLLCQPYELNPSLFSGALSNICHDYYIYDEYRDFRYYKKQCDNGGTVSSDPPPDDGGGDPPPDDGGGDPPPPDPF